MNECIVIRDNLRRNFYVREISTRKTRQRMCVFCSESDRVMRREDRMMGGSEAEAYIEAQRK